MQCQNERGRLMNKDVAFKMLKSRLYSTTAKEGGGAQKDISRKEIWGSRSALRLPAYTMVKDYRTNTSVGNIRCDGRADRAHQKAICSGRKRRSRAMTRRLVLWAVLLTVIISPCLSGLASRHHLPE